MTANTENIFRRAWLWLFPWRYDRRTARRYCKRCGTQQDLYSTGDGNHRMTWYETMGRGNSKCEVGHG